ncbi:hypothetical protein BQ8482_570010 [Mesorhizobium delmotii]|uniref:Uncharacterized protein n=1 Tax=Mesorhizobium delmotii TaxID=1631247 RepID=A0A2P9AUV5_9HYPH|nr:hypothetical protein BQ8482_570010 [Mesorhizobium delmotii]
MMLVMIAQAPPSSACSESQDARHGTGRRRTQRAPAIPKLSQLLKAEMAEQDVRVRSLSAQGDTVVRLELISGRRKLKADLTQGDREEARLAFEVTARKAQADPPPSLRTITTGHTTLPRGLAAAR